MNYFRLDFSFKYFTSETALHLKLSHQPSIRRIISLIFILDQHLKIEEPAVTIEIYIYIEHFQDYIFTKALNQKYNNSNRLVNRETACSDLKVLALAL